MPLYRRVARRGFSNSPFRSEYTVINLAALAQFEAGATVSAQSLAERGVIKTANEAVKILGNGTIDTRLEVWAAQVSRSARAKIEAAGGSVTLVE
jgi:large subunit ribosomal protein L15